MAVLYLSPYLSACGDHLGEYRVEQVQLVDNVPAEAVDGRRLPSGSDYFRIALSSETSLNAKDTGPGLYTEADYCPIRDSNRLIPFGPIANDGKPVEEYRRREKLERGADGRYHYLVYISASSPARKLFTNSEDVIPAYDLRQSKRDLCLRFFVPGYNITPSQSRTVRISAEALANAQST